MSFENHFVVDLFVKLPPFVDRSANNRVLADQPQHEDSIPDLCVKLFTLQDVLRIEAKWIEQSQATNVVVTKKQIRSWQLPPASTNLTPHLWVARRAEFGKYFVAPWTAMVPVLSEAMEAVGPKESGEDRDWRIKLPGEELTEAGLWRELWAFVATLPVSHTQPRG